MKKLLAALFVSIFFVVACQDSSTIVSPDNDSSTDTEQQFTPTEQDSSGSQEGGGRPGFPRI